MERQPVKSKAFKSVGHDAEKNVLEIEFHGGRVYRYEGFTKADFDHFTSRESMGTHFGQHIAGKFKMTKLEAENAKTGNATEI